MPSKPSFLRPTLFEPLPGIVAGFSTRHGGVSLAPYTSLNLGLSTQDDDVHVQQNRYHLFEEVGVSPDRLAIAGQVHEAEVLEVNEPGLYSGYDGLITQEQRLVLCITAADCAAILLADPEAHIIAACHSGWRGTVAEIATKTVAKMVVLGARVARLRAYISPCISAPNFEVGPEVAAQFDSAFVKKYAQKEKPHIDLKAAIVAQLEQAGVSAAHMEVSTHCTYAETDTFFSYRAEQGKTGRMMGFIGMRETDS